MKQLNKDAISIINDAKENLYEEHIEVLDKIKPLWESAPELLEALEAVLRSYEAYAPERYSSDDNVAMAEDTIKKARGE